MIVDVLLSCILDFVDKGGHDDSLYGCGSNSYSSLVDVELFEQEREARVEDKLYYARARAVLSECYCWCLRLYLLIASHLSPSHYHSISFHHQDTSSFVEYPTHNLPVSCPSPLTFC